MELEVFSVYDTKAQAYLPPFFLHNTAMALRIFQNCANDTGHTFGTNPEDYCLFHIGMFDDDTGSLTALQTPKSLGLAQEFKNAPPVPEPTLPTDLTKTMLEQVQK